MILTDASRPRWRENELRERSGQQGNRTAGSSNATASHEWAKEGSLLPQNGTITRPAFAYEQWQKIAESEGEQIARAWFVGANPWLDNDTPVNAIREGLLEEVGEAAQALVDDAFSG